MRQGYALVQLAKDSSYKRGFEIYSFRIKPPNEVQRFIVVLRVFDQDVDYKVILAVFRCQISSLLVVSTLTAHRNRGVKVELQIPGRLDELFQLIDILQLGIAVQEQSRVISCRLMMFM